MERRNIITKVSSVRPNMMESLLTAEKMAMVIILMAKVNILVLFNMDLCTISRVKFKLKIWAHKIKELIIKDHFLKDRKLERVSSRRHMVNWKAILLTISWKEMVNLSGKMEKFIKVSLRIHSFMGKEKLFILIIHKYKDNGNKITITL